MRGVSPEEQALGQLLAVIHRDGGHYQQEHGDVRAVRDAMQWASEQHARAEVEAGRVTRAEAEVERLRTVVEWYADPKNWLGVLPDSWGTPPNDPAMVEQGDRARAALPLRPEAGATAGEEG